MKTQMNDCYRMTKDQGFSHKDFSKVIDAFLNLKW